VELIFNAKDRRSPSMYCSRGSVIRRNRRIFNVSGLRCNPGVCVCQANAGWCLCWNVIIK